jgi:hypothetical protein
MVGKIVLAKPAFEELEEQVPEYPNLYQKYFHIIL